MVHYDTINAYIAMLTALIVINTPLLRDLSTGVFYLQ